MSENMVVFYVIVLLVILVIIIFRDRLRSLIITLFPNGNIGTKFDFFKIKTGEKSEKSRVRNNVNIGEGNEIDLALDDGNKVENNFNLGVENKFSSEATNANSNSNLGVRNKISIKKK